jgi:hypothetical protein
MTDGLAENIILHWHKFDRLTEARKQFKVSPCVYLFTDTKGTALRVGKAEKGLEARYRGGTGYALDAAMHGSGNLVYVASMEKAYVQTVESVLIYSLQPPYNNQGKIIPPEPRVIFGHNGAIPSCLLNSSK